jgi:hypothetical protein
VLLLWPLIIAQIGILVTSLPAYIARTGEAMREALDRLEEALGPELPSTAPEEDLGAATLEDVMQELVAHVRKVWERCLASPVIVPENVCRPVERIRETHYAYVLWRPERPRGELPASEDLCLCFPEPTFERFHRARMPADWTTVHPEAEVQDLWTGHNLCTGWEWRGFACLLEHVPREILLSIEPQQRPWDWHYPPPHYRETFIPRSAHARYFRGRRGRGDPGRTDTP